VHYDNDSGLFLPRSRKALYERRLLEMRPFHHQLLMGPLIVADAASIRPNLLSWWEFDDNNSSATFIDSHGGVNLLSKNASGALATSAVTTASGMFDRGFAPGADNVAWIPSTGGSDDKYWHSLFDLMVGSNFSFGCWFNGTQNGANTSWVFGSYGDYPVAAVIIDGVTGKFFLQSTKLSTTVMTSALSTFVADGVAPIFITVTHAASTMLLSMRLRRASPALDETITLSMAPQGITGGGSTQASSFTFNDKLSAFGANFGGGTNHTSGSMYDGAFFVTKVLSTAELNYLYNAGAGKSYAQFAADSGYGDQWAKDAASGYRFYRQRVTANGGNASFTTLYELAFYGAANGGGGNQAGVHRRNMTSTSLQGTLINFQTALTDGSVVGGDSFGYNHGLPQTITIDFGRKRYFGSCGVGGRASQASQALKSWTIDGSQDGSAWTNLDTVTNKVWSGDELFIRNLP